MARHYTPTARLLPRVENHSADWHEQRRNGIGGSDVSAILGLNPWKSALELWAEKTGKSRPSMDPPSEAAQWGTILEPVVAGELIRHINEQHDPDLKLVASPGALCHIEREWQRCNPDGLLVRERTRVGFIEIKTANQRHAGQWQGEPFDLAGDVAPHALLQVVYSMSVLGYDHAWVGALIGGQSFRVRRVERDPSLEDMVLTRCAEFWDLVQSDTPPEPDGSASASQALSAMHPRAVVEGAAVELDEGTARDLAEYVDLSAQINDAEKRRKTLQQRVTAAIGDHETALVGGRPAATWKAVDSTRLDTKALRLAHPDLAEKYATTSTSRRFIVH